MTRLPPERVPAILCKDLSKSFGPVEALHRLTLLVPRGVTFGLLGPNGAGKTTSIRLWLGLTPPTEGTAFVLGRRIPSREILPRIGYMPQEVAVYPDLTVAQNLALVGRLVGLSEEAIEEGTATVLRLVDISDRRDDLVSTLSGGMRRRTSLAMALLHDPDLLLLDEPTVGVDPELRAAFWAFFRRLTRRGKTVLLTTHYMEEAAKCDFVGLLHRGRLLAKGSPAEIKERTGSDNLDDAFLRLVQGRTEGRGEPTADPRDLPQIPRPVPARQAHPRLRRRHAPADGPRLWVHVRRRGARRAHPRRERRPRVRCPPADGEP